MSIYTFEVIVLKTNKYRVIAKSRAETEKWAMKQLFNNKPTPIGMYEIYNLGKVK